MKPQIAAKEPVAVELEAGQTYAWCSCGVSSNQPFCDGSHNGTGFSPVIIKAEETRTAYLCQCKHTDNPGFCDGSHAKI